MNKDHQTTEGGPKLVCLHLRSKGMYVSGTLDPAVDDGQVGDGHCWCGKTQGMQGPDDKFVGRDLCLPNRTCFVTLG